MKLSIVIITCNRKEELKKTLLSCIDNKINQMEFVIVDNKSTDKTEEMIREVLNDKAIPYTYYYSNENLGVAGGRLKGQSLAKGEYSFFIDDDAIIATPNLLESSCIRLDRDRDIMIAGYNIYEPEHNRFLIGELTKGSNLEECGEMLSYIGCAHIVRNRFFEKKILYPKRLFFGSEELYASLSVWKEDFKVWYFSDLKIHHFPSKINRYVGKERYLNFIINTHIIRKLTYPKLTYPIIHLNLIGRLVKNKMISIQDLNLIFKYLNERFDKGEQNRMDLKVIIKLVLKFGYTKIF